MFFIFIDGATVSKSAEERQETRHLRELRKQLIRVKKENAQLRKRNHYLEGLMIDVEEAALQQEEEKFIKKSKQIDERTSLTCPQCHSKSVNEFDLRGQRYFSCSDCGAKGKKSNQ